MIQTDGEIYHVLGFEESTLWKWFYYPKQSTDSMQSNQNSNGIAHRTTTNNSKICTETQKIPNSQNNLEKEQSWRYYDPWFQTILQSYSNQKSIVLGQK